MLEALPVARPVTPVAQPVMVAVALPVTFQALRHYSWHDQRQRDIYCISIQLDAMPNCRVCRTHDRGRRLPERDWTFVPGPVRGYSIFQKAHNRHVKCLKIVRQLSGGRDRCLALPRFGGCPVSVLLNRAGNHGLGIRGGRGGAVLPGVVHRLGLMSLTQCRRSLPFPCVGLRSRCGRKCL